MSDLKKIRHEAQKRKRAADEIARSAADRIEELIPVGSVLVIRDVHMNGGSFEAKVLSYDGWWVGVGRMRVQSVRTSGIRRVSLSDVIQIVSLPEESGE